MATRPRGRDPCRCGPECNSHAGSNGPLEQNAHGVLPYRHESWTAPALSLARPAAPPGPSPCRGRPRRAAERPGRGGRPGRPSHRGSSRDAARGSCPSERSDRFRRAVLAVPGAGAGRDPLGRGGRVRSGAAAAHGRRRGGSSAHRARARLRRDHRRQRQPGRASAPRLAGERRRPLRGGFSHLPGGSSRRDAAASSGVHALPAQRQPHGEPDVAGRLAARGRRQRGLARRRARRRDSGHGSLRRLGRVGEGSARGDRARRGAARRRVGSLWRQRARRRDLLCPPSDRGAGASRGPLLGNARHPQRVALRGGG